MKINYFNTPNKSHKFNFGNKCRKISPKCDGKRGGGMELHVQYSTCTFLIAGVFISQFLKNTH